LTESERKETPGGSDVCSAKHAGWLTTPLRRLISDPKRILRGLVAEGDHALDLGCGPGFFTLPMAEMVGPAGTVTAVDLQAEMLEMLKKRAERRGLAARIHLQRCAADSIGEIEPADFALAFHMVHEVPDVARFMGEVAGALKPGGRLLLVEPKGHVSPDAFERTEALAAATGMMPVSRPSVRFSRAVVMSMSGSPPS
jgi:ubiquinone/menaquinone biosynthesis C-methylase UbiE